MTSHGLGGARRSGILLHPSSLPGAHGIGDLGRVARDFADFLAAAGQSVWQVLPLAPTGYGDSPYQGLGAFGGNPLLVSLEPLVDEGLLEAGELSSADFPPGAVEFERVIPCKTALLARAAERFHARAAMARRLAFEEFRHGSPELERLALFLALKARAGGEPWWRWPARLAACEPSAVTAAAGELEPEVRAQAFAQFLFAEQWAALRDHCRARGLQLVEDLPILRRARQRRRLGAPRAVRARRRRTADRGGRSAAATTSAPTASAGAIPSTAGTCMARDGFRFFVDRVRARAWRRSTCSGSITSAASRPTGRFRRARRPRGMAQWRPGPGAHFFERCGSRSATDAVHRREPRRDHAGGEAICAPAAACPGWRILQFAFGKDPQAPTFLPHNYERDLVAYSGTHDNDTTLGWWASEGGDSVRTPDDVRREKARALAYLRADGREMNWTAIAALESSVADTVIFPLQDLLGLGSEARMNRPSTASGNWRWRFRDGDSDGRARRQARRAYHALRAVIRAQGGWRGTPTVNARRGAPRSASQIGAPARGLAGVVVRKA